MITMPYKYVEDVAVADIAFEATGKSVEEMFESAAIATQEIMVDLKTVKPVQKKHIKLSAKNIETLLHDFLEELVYLKDAEHLILTKFKIGITIGVKCSLICEASGDKIDYKKQDLKCDIKAITHHMFKVEKGPWKCFVVVDI